MYSQLDEEKIVLEFYRGLREKHEVYLSKKILDIGANDGRTISNTRALVLEYPDVVGYFVEPNPVCYEKLKILYPKIHMIFNFAISDFNGETQMYCNGSHLSPDDNGLLSTIVEKETKRWGSEKWDIINVQTRKYPFSNINFDYISIDAEGMDEIILSQINLEKTWILCIEWNSEMDRENIFNEYCGRYSMNLIHKNSTNLIYGKTPDDIQ